ncbi:hypothetical protein GCM10023165_16890 [Variovorax defluvii]|uniref:SRPBCC family protein n=1 Tax=Variovorax defluvii TaxID=913761 RepID=A0ABP8HEW5_9BURK
MSGPQAEWVEIVESVEVAASPRAVWHVVGDFGGLGQWMPGVTGLQTSGRGPGATRRIHMGSACMLETLVELDERHMQLGYRLDQGPLPARSYTSTLRVSPAEAGARVDWTARCTPDDTTNAARLERTLRQAYRAGLNGLASVFASAAIASAGSRRGGA